MYIRYTVINNGSASGWCEMIESDFIRLTQENPDKNFLIIPRSIDPSEFLETHYIKNNEWFERTNRPTQFHEWDNTLEQWVPNLDVARESVLTKIGVEISTRIYLPVEFEGAAFDADPVSRSRISGTLARIQRGDGLPLGWVGWRDYNNIQRWAEDTPETVQVKLAGLSKTIEDREQALLIAAWVHKSAIMGLQTIEEILSYDVTTGWPT